MPRWFIIPIQPLSCSLDVYSSKFLVSRLNSRHVKLVVRSQVHDATLFGDKLPWAYRNGDLLWSWHTNCCCGALSAIHSGSWCWFYFFDWRLIFRDTDSEWSLLSLNRRHCIDWWCSLLILLLLLLVHGGCILSLVSWSCWRLLKSEQSLARLPKTGRQLPASVFQNEKFPIRGLHTVNRFERHWNVLDLLKYRLLALFSLLLRIHETDRLSCFFKLLFMQLDVMEDWHGLSVLPLHVAVS